MIADLPIKNFLTINTSLKTPWATILMHVPYIFMLFLLQPTNGQQYTPDQHTSNSNKGMTHNKIQSVYAAT